jgi:hypothetical protein
VHAEVILSASDRVTTDCELCGSAHGPKPASRYRVFPAKARCARYWIGRDQPRMFRSVLSVKAARAIAPFFRRKPGIFGHRCLDIDTRAKPYVLLNILGRLVWV